MAYAKQQGQAHDRVVTQGEYVETSDGHRGEVESFGGGSHQWVTIRDRAGYVHTTQTVFIKPKKA